MHITFEFKGLRARTRAALSEPNEDPGTHQQTQNRQLYRNHDEEMPGQHKEHDHHHYYGDEYNGA